MQRVQRRRDDSDHKNIPQAVGLIAGRTAQEYNQRKTPQAMVKGLSALHEHVIELLEVPETVYRNLYGSWWQFKGTRSIYN